MSNTFIDLGLPLLAAHLLGDFVFQSDHTVANKRRPPVLARHALIHAALAYLLIGWWTAWWLPALVFAIHGAIDFVKTHLAAGSARLFFIDQAAHLASLAALAWCWEAQSRLSNWTGAFGPRWDRVLIMTIGGILCVRAAAIIIGFWVQPYLDEIRKNARAIDGAEARTRGLTTGGRAIGQWERALIFLFVGTGQMGAIGFLITAKSVFRFGELKDHENRMEAEYITIGTLMSFGVAVAVSFGTFWLARHI